MGLDWSTPDHGPIQSARSSLRIAGGSNLTVKARKANGDIDPFPVSSHNPPFLCKTLVQTSDIPELRSSTHGRLEMLVRSS